jgi:hypothetical protein
MPWPRGASTWRRPEAYRTGTWHPRSIRSTPSTGVSGPVAMRKPVLSAATPTIRRATPPGSRLSADGPVAGPSQLHARQLDHPARHPACASQRERQRGGSGTDRPPAQPTPARESTAAVHLRRCAVFTYPSTVPTQFSWQLSTTIWAGLAPCSLTFQEQQPRRSAIAEMSAAAARGLRVWGQSRPGPRRRQDRGEDRTFTLNAYDGRSRRTVDLRPGCWVGPGSGPTHTCRSSTRCPTGSGSPSGRSTSRAGTCSIGTPCRSRIRVPKLGR